MSADHNRPRGLDSATMWAIIAVVGLAPYGVLTWFLFT